MIQFTRPYFWPSQVLSIDIGHQRLLRVNEQPNSTTSMTAFYTPDGTLQILDQVAQGPQNIIALRNAGLPTDGTVIWNVCIHPKLLSTREK
jgi:hypothetical protein